MCVAPSYEMRQLALHNPIVFFLCWFFARTLAYLPALK